VKTKTTVEISHSDVLEVKSSFDENEINSLLKTGNWVFLHGGLAHKDDMGFSAKPCYVLGRIK
jgi:hypothetical protein